MRLDGWETFLPFQEAIDVKFGEWLEQAHSWLVILGEDEGESDAEVEQMILSRGYLLDLMGQEVEPLTSGQTADELKQNVQTYCKKVDNLLRKSDMSGWEERAMERMEPEMLRLTDGMPEMKAARQSAVAAVKALADELNALEEFFWSDLKEEQFMVLSNRLLYRDCKEAIKSAHDHVRKEHNAWPKKYERDRAIAMKERIKMRLLTEARGEELKEYIDLDYPVLLDDACFGQYLFKSRHDLTIELLQEMVMYCTMINDLNQYIDPNLSIKKRKEKALGRELDAEEKVIVSHLTSWAEKAEWRSGATTGSITMGINRMLGVGYQLEPEMQPLSEALWKLLKVRRNCDAEKSARLTWLNIVGWCVRQRMLSGGSPALCKLFFPRCGQDDYKFIDKGRGEPSASFKKIEPLLAKYLR